MKTPLILIFLLLVFAPSAVTAQLPPPPINIAGIDLRDNNIRMRSNELERIKREADKPTFESTREKDIRFALVKEDFEKIQKLQTAIVKAYTSGKTIDFSKIGQFSIEISKKAVKLNQNLFGSGQFEIVKPESRENRGPRGLRDLIIELDKAIGRFVTSPVFSNNILVDPTVSENSQIELERIISLSKALNKESLRLQED